MSGQIGTTTTASKWMTFFFMASLLGLSKANETEVEDQESRIGNINVSGMANNNNAGIIAAVIIFAIIIDAAFVWLAFQTLGRRRRSGHGRPQYVNKNFNSRSDAPEDEPNVLSSLSNAYQSIDVLDSTFGLMKIDSEACRAKSVCEMEAKAAQSPFFAVIMRSANKYVSGLERYPEARYFGRTGQDCSLIYSECPSSWNPY